MEADLRAAIQQYEEQLLSVGALLEATPDSVELLELQAELTEALDATRQAIQEWPSSEPAAGPDADRHVSSPASQAQDAAIADPATVCSSDAAQLIGPCIGPTQHPAGSRLDSRPAAVFGSPAAMSTQPVSERGRNNPRMHPRNAHYSQEPDFKQLAEQYPGLRPHVTVGPNGRAHFDYRSWEATHELTKTLLHHEHGIVWRIPPGQLIPAVTNRANYIHWLHDLLQLSSPEGEQGPIRGLDIGCGANLIYCLLGSAIYGWAMVGTDITGVAVASARDIIAANPQLSELLEVRHVRDDISTAAGAGLTATDNGAGPVTQAAAATAAGAAPVAAGATTVGGKEAAEDQAATVASGVAGGGGGILMAALRDATECFHFSMCNPPFFGSAADANQNPNTACGGTAAEMVYPGGELAFIQRMVADSLQLRGRVHWYTSMVGKKVTLKALRKVLHGLPITALRTTEFAQGKTSRWAVAWSFAVDRNKAQQPLLRPVTGGGGAGDPGVLPVANRPARQVSFTLPGHNCNPRGVLKLLEEVLRSRGLACIANAQAFQITAKLPQQSHLQETSTPTDTSEPARKKQRVEQHDLLPKPVLVRVVQAGTKVVSVMGSIANNCEDREAMQFAQLMKQVQADVEVLLAGR